MSRHAHCLFCDDIRYEIGNKTSILGIYNGVLQAASVPVVLPKLCIATFLSSPVDMPVSSLSIRVSLNDQLLQQIDLTSENLAEVPKVVEQWVTEDDPIIVLVLGAHIVLSPFVFDKEGAITVTAIVDGEELIAGKLRLRIERQLH
jgi:hypothetical protein